jgi:hypothetical protein
MFAYILFGVVVPERADLSIRNARRSLEDPQTGNAIGTIQVDIDQSQVIILLQTELVLDFATVKNLAYAQTRVFINAAAVFLGGGYDLDIRKGINLASAVVETFAPRSAPIVKYVSENVRLTAEEVIRATFKANGRFIEYALEDFADGLRHSGRNAMFFFYRAFDSLRQFLGAVHGIDDRSKQWDKLREVTSISREDIESIKRFADPVRHGDAATWETAQIAKAERLTWSAVHAAIQHFRDRGYK